MDKVIKTVEGFFNKIVAKVKDKTTKYGEALALQPQKDRVLVIGAGIIGLSTAKLLRERLDCEVVIYSDKHPLDTTSAGAGGLWEPYFCEPAEIVDAWAERTLEYLLALHAAGDDLIELVHNEKYITKDYTEASLPTWRHACNNATNFKALTPKDLPAPGPPPAFANWPHVFTFTSPVMNSPFFLTRLLSELSADPKVTMFISGQNNADVNARGAIKKYAQFKTMSDAVTFAKTKACNVIANCTGLGSQRLLDDEDAVSGRGVIVLYQRPPGVNTCYNAKGGDLTTDENTAYFIPRGDIIVVGGTFLEEDYYMSPRESEVTRIKRNAELFCPLLKEIKAEPIKVWVGLRPFRRSGVRFDMVMKDGMPVFNNYGHGGAGWTLHYGAASATVEMIQEHLANPTRTK